MRLVEYIVVHCSAGGATQPTQSIIEYWKNILGWRHYGYHQIINADGTAERLTDDEKIANGVKGYNHNGIHICYKGGWDGTDTRTPEQKAKLIELIKGYKKKYPLAKLVGHRDLSPDLNGDGVITPNEFVKLCPCFSVKDEYRNL